MNQIGDQYIYVPAAIMQHVYKRCEDLGMEPGAYIRYAIDDDAEQPLLDEIQALRAQVAMLRSPEAQHLVVREALSHGVVDPREQTLQLREQLAEMAEQAQTQALHYESVIEERDRIIAATRYEAEAARAETRTLKEQMDEAQADAQLDDEGFRREVEKATEAAGQMWLCLANVRDEFVDFHWSVKDMHPSLHSSYARIVELIGEGSEPELDSAAHKAIQHRRHLAHQRDQYRMQLHNLQGEHHDLKEEFARVDSRRDALEGELADLVARSGAMAREKVIEALRRAADGLEVPTAVRVNVSTGAVSAEFVE